MDPQWTERIYDNNKGEDFLGIRIVSENILSYLLPGIITVTQRARYYAFYCWLLIDYEKYHPTGWSLAQFIKRREQIFAIANFAFQPAMDFRMSVLGLAGYNEVTDHWHQHKSTGTIPLTLDNYLNDKYGGYRIYAGVLQNLGAFRTVSPSKIEVLSFGKQLANGFESSIQGTEYFQHRSEYDLTGSIECSVLEEYGRQCHLSQLQSQPDVHAVQDFLFQFSSGKPLPSYDSNNLPVQNMRGSLGIILDMCRKDSPTRLDSLTFLQNTLYSACPDYSLYQPSVGLEPFLAIWQIRTLRELYVFSLYGLWASFLDWLRRNGPESLEGYLGFLDQHVHLISTIRDVADQGRTLSNWKLTDYLDTFLNAANISQRPVEERTKEYALQSESPVNEFEIIRKLQTTDISNTSEYVGQVLLLLTGVYLRLSAIQLEDRYQVWPFAELGGQRRRSLALFVEQLKKDCEHGRSLLDIFTWIIRDYILTQHTIAALEKWRNRKANSFHFTYDSGYFEWVRTDSTGFAASRFDQAYNMLTDLGLINLNDEQHSLTQVGSEILNKVLKELSDY